MPKCNRHTKRPRGSTTQLTLGGLLKAVDKSGGRKPCRTCLCPDLSVMLVVHLYPDLSEMLVVDKKVVMLWQILPSLSFGRGLSCCQVDPCTHRSSDHGATCADLSPSSRQGKPQRIEVILPPPHLRLLLAPTLSLCGWAWNSCPACS